MKKYLYYLFVPLFAVLGALIFVNLLANVHFKMDAVQAKLSLHTSLRGETIIKVPPVGEIKAKTHNIPVSITIGLENIYLDELKKMLAESPEQEKLFEEAKVVLTREIRKFVMITLALGFAGGLFGLLVIQRRRLKELLAGGVIGLLVVSVLLFGTYRTYDIEKFRNPEYTGMIKAAPWMIGLVEESLATVNTWGKEMRGIANNLFGMFQRVDSLQAMGQGDGEVKILHVSDIHNNPASFDFMSQVVKSFGVDFIIDSGDMSDFGTPLESAMLGKVQKLEVPYIFIPGNHETPAIVSEIKKIPNVTVLDGKVKQIRGLNIAGIEDPSSHTGDYQAPDQSKIREATGKMEDIITESGVNPDIVVIHNPRIAKGFWGKVPVVLTGHDHQYKIKLKSNSVLIDAGTSGASGVGALMTKKEIPYSFVLLHFARTGEGIMRLKYTDTIRISNLQSGYSLERRVYSEMFANPAKI